MLIVYDMWLFLPVEHRHRAGVILLHTHSIVSRVHGDRRHMSQQVQDEDCADHLVEMLRFYTASRQKMNQPCDSKSEFVNCKHV